MRSTKAEIEITERIVHKVLLENQNARKDNWLLYFLVVRELKPELVNKSFEYVMCNHLSLPAFETVTRTRRKLQREYEDLRADENMQMVRTERELEFEEYSRR